MTTTTTVIETSAVGPPPSSAALSLPLSFLDIIWITFHPIRRLLFYPHPCSQSHFLNTILPNLKHSLSLALRHFLPLSGNLLYPTTTAAQNKPLFRYISGDSVPLTISVSTSDFDDLVANHPREADQFYEFAPEMPPPKDEPDFKLIPVFALKITLFPERGICLGFANHHAIGDASSIFRFMSAWASISRLGGTADPGPPSMDRSLLKDPLDIRSIFWEVMKKAPLRSSEFPVPTNRVRATFTFRPEDIAKLKESAIAEKPSLVRVSSFVVTMAYAWTCLLRSGTSGKTEEKIEEMFIFTVDIRGRVDPPIPDYFGNCVGYAKAGLERQVAVGEGGFAIAAEMIAEDIKRVNKKGEVLKGAENWMKGWEKFGEWSFTGVSGSPRFDLCGLDFGWGRARKLEVLSIDGESYSMSLCKSSDCDGGLEIGLSLPRERMEAFAALFAEGLM